MENGITHVNRKGATFFVFYIGLINFLFFVDPLAISVAGSTFNLGFSDLLVMLLALIVGLLTIKRGSIRYNPTAIGLLLFLAVSLISLIYTKDIGRWLIGCSNYVECVLILLIFSNLSENKATQKAKILFKWYYLSFLTLVARVFYETFAVNQGNFLIGNKIKLLIGGSNYLASLLLIPMALSLTRTFLLKTTTWADAFILFASLAAIIFTGSRTVIIISAVVIIVFVLGIVFTSRLSVKKRLSSLGIAIMGIVFLYKVSFKFLMQMVSEGRFSDLSQQANVLSRFDIFQIYLAAWGKHPLFGNGFMNIEVDGVYTLGHNTILELLADNGILGILLMFFCILSIFYIMIKLIKRINFNRDRELWCWVFGLLLGFTLTLIHGMFEPNWGSRLYMVVMFMGIGILSLIDPTGGIKND
ncbi:hypothetical protein BSQ39_05105 [Loigolactobacillus backii]|uniref:O-antigen ligase family protein n=1 Tax=Loigolactobacillus backii TaxID=375175 RepID=UPI000C1C8945|nr:O-antigen ligase family protein [Loigolactobacillus backii]PIO82996.1 hypothetical protein BSQ39_05105 [Loigolactobacillus backii]